jgi:hypothetical protein
MELRNYSTQVGNTIIEQSITLSSLSITTSAIRSAEAMECTLESVKQKMKCSLNARSEHERLVIRESQYPAKTL